MFEVRLSTGLPKSGRNINNHVEELSYVQFISFTESLKCSFCDFWATCHQQLLICDHKSDKRYSKRWIPATTRQNSDLFLISCLGRSFLLVVFQSAATSTASSSI